MIFFQGYKIMRLTYIVFGFLPHFNLGLLSDYKICGDSECESLMSRVQATRDHRGKDCRFLSFRRGDTIFVYHKLTGNRDDLWAGTIDRQFGHFPKDAVQEEQVYATTEKVVETQKSDFICMDEFGYPIDSSHLDNENDDEQRQNTPNQDSETTPTILPSDDMNTERPSAASVDPTTQSPVSAQQPDSTLMGEDEQKPGDDAASNHKEAHEIPSALDEQGGSPSSSWLGSSVTGWLGLGKGGQPGNLAKTEKNDEGKEMQAEASLTSSVTGWLGLGGEGKPDYAVNNREEEQEKASASFTSTMTGWLNFGGELKADSMEKKQDQEKEINDDSEPKETFRSRRMSLDLEASQLHEEEKKEMGTLDWLGNGLSNTLGFGLSNQEPKTTKEEKKKLQSNSWMNFGVEDILGFRTYESENEESKSNGFEETDKDKTLEQLPVLVNVDSSQLQPLQEEKQTEPETQRREENALPKEVPEVGDCSISISPNKDTDISDVEKHDQFLQSESVTLATEDFNNNKKDSVLPDDAAVRVDEKDISPPSNLQESSPVIIPDLISQTLEEGSAETVGEGQQSPTLMGNKGETGEEETNSMGENNKDFLRQSEYKADLNLTEPPIANIEEGNKDQAAEGLEGDRALINEADNTDESTVASFGISASSYSHENERNNAEMDLVENFQNIYSLEENQESSDAEESSEIRQPSFIPSSDTANENESTHSEDESVSDADILDSVDMNGDNSTETEKHHIGLVHNRLLQPDESSHQAFEPSASTNSSTLSLNENVPEDILKTDIKVDNTGHDLASLNIESGEVVEELKEVEHISGEREQKYEGEKQEMDDTKEEEEHDPVDAINTKDKQEDVKKTKKLDDIEGLTKEERFEFKEEERQKEVFKKEQEEVKQEEEKVKEEQEMQDVEQLQKTEEQIEVVGLTDVEQLSKEKMQGTNNELEEVKPAEGDEFKKEKKQEEEVGELKIEEDQKQLKEVDGLQEIEMEQSEKRPIQSSQLENNYEVDEPELKSNVMERHNEDPKTEWTGDNEEEMIKQEKVKEPLNNVEGGMEKEENSLKCPIDLCTQATEDESVKDRNENISEDDQSSSADEVIAKGEKENAQILAEESVEKDEETLYDAAANEETMENMKRNTIGAEDIYINNTNSISEHAGVKDGENDLNFAGEDEDSDNDGKNAGETRSSGISTDKIHFEHEIERLSSTSSFAEKTEMEPSPPPGFQNSTAPSIPPVEHDSVTGEDERTGAFGLFKNAISFFTETKNSTKSAPILDTNTDEMPESQASLTPTQTPDSTSASSQVSEHDLSRDSPVTTPTQQHTQLPVPTSETPSPNAGTLLQTNALSKFYKNLLHHVSVDEMTIFIELFGAHKMQFLDYMFGSSETVTIDPSNNESILSDLERLLHYHRETLIAPSMKLTDSPQEDKEKTRTLIALQKLEQLLERLRDAFTAGKSDVINSNRQAEVICVDARCRAQGQDKEESKKAHFTSDQDTDVRRDEWVEVEKGSGQLDGVIGKIRKSEAGTRGQKVTEGSIKQILDVVHQITKDVTSLAYVGREHLIWITVQVVSSLPDDIRPGPDLYGVPWEPVIFSSLVGLVTVLLFTCRCYSSIKSRMYRRKEEWMVKQVAQLLEEKCKVLETLSKCQQEYDDLEDSMRDSGALVQSEKTEEIENKARQLEHAKKELEMDLDQLKNQLEQQREHRMEQERRIAVLEESMKTLEEETKDLQTQEEQAQTTLKVYSMNSDRLQKNLETAGEEKRLLQESNAQLRQQVEGWAERVSELESEMRRCEVAYSGMQQDVANKDERIMSLTDCLLRMRAWDSDLEEEEGEKEGKKETVNGAAAKGRESKSSGSTDTQGHLQKVQKLIYAAKLNADLKSLDEDKDRVFSKLNNEVKAKEDLQESIKDLEKEKLSLQSDAVHYSDEVQRLQQKLQIMTEMYQENELKLHRLLTVEERERLQKEEKLNKADKNIALAIEGVNNYRQRAEEMEEELEKTKQSYQTQISAHEKKAHNNWLAARAAERDLADIRRENALLRQKLTDTQFKLDAIDKDPYALNTLARPQPFRAEKSPYGPSPPSRPASETRPFLSPPTLMDRAPTRLSPRVTRGPAEPPSVQGELERSAGPHSDSGSISPTWGRDPRGPQIIPPSGPVGPPGYMLPEPGGPNYRRPPPHPGAMGVLPPLGSLPLGPPLPHPKVFSSGAPPGQPHSKDMADETYRENSLGPSEQGNRESGPGDHRTSPEADPRMSGPPTSGNPMGPMEFARRAPRAPYGPPPPDFYPPRGPGGPPMRPMWAPPPPGMMFHTRFPGGGPPLPFNPLAQFASTMRLPAPDGLPPPSMGPPAQQLLPSPPQSQSPDEHTPSPEDAI